MFTEQSKPNHKRNQDSKKKNKFHNSSADKLNNIRMGEISDFVHDYLNNQDINAGMKYRTERTLNVLKISKLILN